MTELVAVAALCRVILIHIWLSAPSRSTTTTSNGALGSIINNTNRPLQLRCSVNYVTRIEYRSESPYVLSSFASAIQAEPL